MFPTYQDGDIVIALSWLVTIKKNDVVVIVDPRTSRLLLKRIKDQSVRKYFVIGDNQLESTDSRQFGWVHQRNIIGKVILQIKTEQGVFA